MKKAQILSAIALAAALGVVAPVASVSAFKEPSNGNHGTATCADSKRAAKAIENNKRYAAATGFRAAAKKASDTDATVYANDNIANTLVDKAVVVLQAYKQVSVQPTRNAGQYYTSAKMTANNYKIQNYGQAGGTLLSVSDWSVENIKEVIDAAKATYGYDKVYKLWHAQQNGDQAAFNAAVSGYNQVMTFNITNANTEWTTGFPTLTNAANTAYVRFADLFVVVDQLQEIYDAYTPNLKAIKSAYNKMVSADLIRTYGAQLYRDNLSEVKMPGLKYFASLILEQGDVTGDYWDETVASADELNTLEDIVVDVLNACNVAREDGIIYDSIIAAAYNYGRINGINVASDSEKVSVAKTLVNYTAEEDNKDKDVTPTDAPNSGILGTAEGSATTVSIVAGLATSLTALGAGVVAYRNARRK